MSRDPVLVIVSGPPAAGKTSLTKALRDRLQLPLLSLDAIKEAVMEVLPPRTVDDTERLGQAAERVLVSIGASLLDAGPGAILESAFHVDRATHDLRPLVERCATVIIHCQAPEAVIVERYVSRAHEGGRDPGHMDRQRAADLPRELQQGVFEPPDLNVPVLRVDTSDTYDPDLDRVLLWVEERARASR